MKNDIPPLTHFFRLSDLTQAGSTVTVEAAGDELARLAQWAGIEAVSSFRGEVTLKRNSQTGFVYAAALAASIVQRCVVTLEPVRSRLSRQIVRELILEPKAAPAAGELTLSAGDDDVPETILSPEYDLAAPLLEEFVLAIDPYPRKQGVAFRPPAEPQEKAESPFAVLKSLKKQG
jgi:uncharacterized metal-binding protein YceD (DUF177 family)